MLSFRALFAFLLADPSFWHRFKSILYGSNKALHKDDRLWYDEKRQPNTRDEEHQTHQAGLHFAQIWWQTHKKT
jgi:hypothetical protein